MRLNNHQRRRIFLGVKRYAERPKTVANDAKKENIRSHKYKTVTSIRYDTIRNDTIPDKTRQDKTIQDKTRQYNTRQYKTRQDKTIQDNTRQYKTIGRDTTTVKTNHCGPFILVYNLCVFSSNRDFICR